MGDKFKHAQGWVNDYLDRKVLLIVLVKTPELPFAKTLLTGNNIRKRNIQVLRWLLRLTSESL